MEFEYELTEPEWVAFDQLVLDRTAAAFKAAVGAWKVRATYGLTYR